MVSQWAVLLFPVHTIWHKASVRLKEIFRRREGFQICPHQFFRTLNFPAPDSGAPRALPCMCPPCDRGFVLQNRILNMGLNRPTPPAPAPHPHGPKQDLHDGVLAHLGEGLLPEDQVQGVVGQVHAEREGAHVRVVVGGVEGVPRPTVRLLQPIGEATAMPCMRLSARGPARGRGFRTWREGEGPQVSRWRLISTQHTMGTGRCNTRGMRRACLSTAEGSSQAMSRRHPHLQCNGNALLPTHCGNNICLQTPPAWLICCTPGPPVQGRLSLQHATSACEIPLTPSFFVPALVPKVLYFRWSQAAVYPDQSRQATAGSTSTPQRGPHPGNCTKPPSTRLSSTARETVSLKGVQQLGGSCDGGQRVLRAGGM